MARNSPDFPFVTTPDGVKRYLACLPPKPVLSFPKLGDAYAVIPQSEWRETQWLPKGTRITDQNGYNACVDFSSVGAFEDTWAVSGQTPRVFSNFFTYCHVNGGVDQGAVISDAIESFRNDGLPLDGLVKTGTIKLNKLTAEAIACAKRFKLKEAYALTSFAEIGTAHMMGFFCVFGIQVGNSFMTLDSGGVPGIGGSGGHALRSINLTQIKTGRFKGRWAVVTPNSWGTSYGDGGICNLVEDHFYSRYGIDGWAFQGVLEDPEDTTNPPAIKKAAKSGARQK